MPEDLDLWFASGALAVSGFHARGWEKFVAEFMPERDPEELRAAAEDFLMSKRKEGLRAMPLGKPCTCGTGAGPHFFGTVPRCEYYRHHCDSCHKLRGCTLQACGFFDIGPRAAAAKRRPADYDKMTAQEQWGIDKMLGILDWDGDPKQ